MGGIDVVGGGEQKLTVLVQKMPIFEGEVI